MGTLAIVITNNMASMDATTPNNGFNLDGAPYGGTTDPVWIGVVQQMLTVMSWYLNMASLIVTLVELLGAVIADRTADILFPTLVFLAGHVTYHVSLFFQDIAYWFNMFVTTDAVIRIPEYDGLLNYVVTEIPTGVYLLFVLVNTVYILHIWRVPRPPKPTVTSLASRSRR